MTVKFLLSLAKHIRRLAERVCKHRWLSSRNSFKSPAICAICHKIDPGKLTE